MPVNNNNQENKKGNGQSAAVSGKKSRPGKSTRTLAIILTVLLLIALTGIVGYFVQTRNNASTELPQSFVSYPTVSTTVSSSRDGKEHSIDIDVVVEYAEGVSESISHDAAYEKISKTISSLDYDDLRQFDSIETIEGAVLKELGTIAGDGNVHGVYVGNIAIDFPGLVDSAQNQNSANSSFNQRLRGLFQNAK